MRRTGRRMNERLWQALEARGWDVVYGERLNLPTPNAAGECTIRAPFSDMEDKDPSFAVNVSNGLWHCHSRPNRTGDFVHLLCWLDSKEVDPRTGELIPLQYTEVERELLLSLNLVTTINAEQVKAWRDRLGQDPTILQRWSGNKSWAPGALYQCGVGWSDEENRFTLPMRDGRRRLFNAKLYLSGGRPKSSWILRDICYNVLFPDCAWDEDAVVLVEGEPDALTLRSYQFPGCSGTHGAQQPVPEGNWWVGKRVHVLFDADEAGESAIKRAVDVMLGQASSLVVCRLPEWPGRPEHADVSDYVWWLRTQGVEYADIQLAIRKVLESGEEVRPARGAETTPIQVAFSDVLNAVHGETPLDFRACVVAQSVGTVYKAPTNVRLTCRVGSHQYCRVCPMMLVHGGVHNLELDVGGRPMLELIMTSDNKQLEVYKDQVGVPRQCPEVSAHVSAYANVRPLTLIPPTPSACEHEVEVSNVEHQRCEALFVSSTVDALETNRDYSLVARNYADPSTQRATIWVTQASPINQRLEDFELTEELYEQLRQFQPATNSSVLKHLATAADDLARSVTLILGRPDLHMAYRCVWHSAIEFKFKELRVTRGWLEALILGDTRCGKSAAFKRLAEHYGLGLLVDCKLQTVAGVLGACVQSAVTGEHVIIPGVMPRHDKRLICFDEFHSADWGREGLIRHLSSTRAEGVVTITKAASASFPARVRAIWLANPGQGKLLEELSGCGVEYIQRLIPQPEDIARFDFAMTVAQSEVPSELLHDQQPPSQATQPRELHRSLLAWVYSRSSEQVVFTPAAEGAVLSASHWLCQQYDASIPLVEPADQRMRVAKLAVSVAAQCFSCSADGTLLVVDVCHVQAAMELLLLWFNKPSMGYHTYSARFREDRELKDVAQLSQLFTELGTHAQGVAQELLRRDLVTERSIASLCPGDLAMTSSLLQRLISLRALRAHGRGRKDGYELTPAFINWLKQRAGRQ